MNKYIRVQTTLELKCALDDIKHKLFWPAHYRIEKNLEEIEKAFKRGTITKEQYTWLERKLDAIIQSFKLDKELIPEALETQIEKHQPRKKTQ